MFTINGRKIGNEYDPYIIAELSANHGGSIERAKASIKAAKIAGASAVKMQTYTPETMTIESNKDDFLIKSGLWEGYNLFNLYREAFTPFEWHKELFNYARQIGITIFSSPFDETAVDLLSSLDSPAYKIASFELTDLPLIKYVAKKNKPMLISTGMASIDEIAETLEVCKMNGNNELLLFHCISSYPAPVKDTNLLNIKALKKEFEVLVDSLFSYSNKIFDLYKECQSKAYPIFQKSAFFPPVAFDQDKYKKVVMSLLDFLSKEDSNKERTLNLLLKEEFSGMSEFRINDKSMDVITMFLMMEFSKK